MSDPVDQIIEAMARAIWLKPFDETQAVWFETNRGVMKELARKRARAALAAAYTALEAQGWRVVPTVPTEDQTNAADAAMRRGIVQGPGKWATLDKGLRAFLAAAPPPPGATPSCASARETGGEGGL